jgi:hypothetical protein
VENGPWEDIAVEGRIVDLGETGEDVNWGLSALE